mgnify:CR=1 FL=1
MATCSAFLPRRSIQTVVADDNTTVKVVEVAGSETAAVEGNERTDFRGNYRHHLQNHPLRLVAVARRTERLHDLEALERLGLALLAAVAVGLVAQLVAEAVESAYAIKASCATSAV